MPAVHDLRASDGKRGPSRQDLRAVYSRTGVCSAFRIHGAQILPKPAHFGCITAKYCHEPALFPSEAPSGTHEAKKLPWLTARGTHRVEILPRPTARKRTVATSCHGRPLSRMLPEYILPRWSSAAWACSSGHREHTGKYRLQRGQRQSKQPAVRRRSRVRRPRDLACGSKQILLRNHSGATKSGNAARTKCRAIQQRMPTRPRNREKILGPFAKKRHRKHTRVVWRT